MERREMNVAFSVICPMNSSVVQGVLKMKSKRASRLNEVSKWVPFNPGQEVKKLLPSKHEEDMGQE
jgi:hypothetical protein